MRESLSRLPPAKEIRNELLRRKFAKPGGLIEFIRHFWDVLEPTTEFVDGWAIRAICEHLEAVTAGKITRLLINVPPGFAKALDSDTPVLTTWGWKRHGDLVPGDFVYGPDGKPKRVIAVTVPVTEPAFEVVFDDGARIVAGKGHQWQVERDYPYGAPGGRRCRKTEVTTTPELILTVKSRPHQRPDRIALAAPVEMPTRKLMVEPYVLGAWLGDGASNSGVIYTAHQDVDHFSKFGYQTKKMPKTIEGRQDFYRVTVEDLGVRLRMMGLLNNKHIPDDYLESSVKQRWELVRGLMDTDGTASKNGHCSYVTKLKHLAYQIVTLLCSLGVKAHISETWSVNKGIKFGPYYQIVFTAPLGAKVFDLVRKQERVKFAENSRTKGRYVTSVEPVGERIVNCIQVEGQLYLCGKNFVTTHNSLIVNVFWPAFEWSTVGAHLRYVSFSYAAHLTARDNEKFRDLLLSPNYREVYGHQFDLVKVGAEKVQSSKTGWKFASSVGGVGTGERGDRILCFPAHEIVQTEIGPQRIGDIVENRWQGRVWSADVATGVRSLKPITAWRKNPGSDLVEVVTRNGARLRCTPNHKIWTSDGWRAAGLLCPGDVIPDVAVFNRSDRLRRNFKSVGERIGVGLGFENQPRGFVREFGERSRVVKALADAGSVRGQAQVLPAAPHENRLDGRRRHAVLPGETSRGLISSGVNFAHDVFGKMRSAILEPAVAFAVGNVLRARSILKIAQARVRPVVVPVPNFLPVGARADESLHHELMRHSVDGLAVDAQRVARVALVRGRRHDFAGNRQRFAFSVNDARQAFQPPVTGNEVVFGADDGSPDFVVSVSPCGHVDETFCLEVQDNHTFFCGERQDGLLVSNCDDPHNVREAESDNVREATVQWFREAMQNRLNDLARGVIIVIMQRVNEMDVSGCIVENYPAYDHLMIPMEFEPDRRCTTCIGWTDPRQEENELAWPERYPEDVLRPFKTMPYVWAGQYMQRPEPRGGGIIKRDYWKIWDAEAQAANDVKPGCYPSFDYIIASFDGALGQKQENDWSALTVWGTWVETSEEQRVMEQFGTPSIMLIAAWRKKLTLHGRTDIEQVYGETKAEFEQRRKQSWGLVEHIADTCRRLRVNKLLIEAKANGHDVANEMRRLYGREDWQVVLDDPGKFDKTARMYSIQVYFADGRVWRPDTDWADMVETEMAQFPKGAHDDLCLVGDTNIVTRRGVVPIRNVRKGDYALTPVGWCKVLAAGFTGHKEVISRTLAGAAQVVGTPNHPVFSLDTGFVALDTVAAASTVGLRLCDLIKTLRQMKYGMTALNTTEWGENENTTLVHPPRTQVEKVRKGFMSLYGKINPAKKYPQILRFTIETATLLILALITWSAYQKIFIVGFLKESTLTLLESIFLRSDTWRPRGTSLMKVANGIVKSLLNPWTPHAPRNLAAMTGSYAPPSRVSGAENCLSEEISADCFVRESIAPTPAPQTPEEGRTPTRTTQPVFNMTVEGAHCYYANGVLVHNCDSATAALRHLNRMGLLIRAAENSAVVEEMAFPSKPKRRRLYEV